MRVCLLPTDLLPLNTVEAWEGLPALPKPHTFVEAFTERAMYLRNTPSCQLPIHRPEDWRPASAGPSVRLAHVGRAG